MKTLFPLEKVNLSLKIKIFKVKIYIFADVYQIRINKNILLQMPNGYSLLKVQGLNFAEVNTPLF